MALGVIFGAPSATRAQTMAATGGDHAQIAALYKTFVEGFNKKNADEIMSIYANNGTLFVFDVVPPRQYPSWAAYRQNWVGLFKSYKTGKVAVSDLNISVDSGGNAAWTHYVTPGTFIGSNGSKLTFVVRSTDVLQKIHGKWLIVQEHNSFPVTFPALKVDIMSKP